MRASRTEGQRPLIIVGTGRCGSTLLHRLLAEHDQLGWLSTFNETLPGQTWLSAFSRLYRAPLPSRLKTMRAFPKPFEAYRFWETYLPGFSRRDAPLTAADVDPGQIEPIRRATSQVLRFQGRERLLVKVTGWSRIAYFDRIYPDARFVCLHRDPRSIVSSWIKAGWLDVTSAPDSADWQWGTVPPAQLAVWEELGGGPVLSTALKIRLDLDDIAANGALFPDRFHELSYEELITEPEPVLRRLCEFAGLEWTTGFDAAVRGTEMYDSTETWRKHLDPQDAERALELLRRTEPDTSSVPAP
jgi:Sulfotransferase family